MYCAAITFCNFFISLYLGDALKKKEILNTQEGICDTIFSLICRFAAYQNRQYGV